MSDRQVSIDARVWPLGPPFIVLATQNPYEFEGTYPLPESQLDRFLVRIRLGYPDRLAEREILKRHRDGEPVDALRPVLGAADVVALQLHARNVRVDDQLNDYILDLIHATRDHPDIVLGASTRAAIFLYRAAQALAVVRGREYCVPDDVKQMAAPVLAHRLVTRTLRSHERGDFAEKLMTEIMGRTPVPT
jgi:MoxR-like ATPase